MTNNNKIFGHYLFLMVLMFIMFIPIIATAIYATSGDWSNTILPEEWTTKWLVQIWTDERFLRSFLHSILLCTFTALMAILIIFPVVLAVHTDKASWEKWLNVILVLPFTLPPVVASIGVLKLYSNFLAHKSGTFFILAGCYFTIVLPFVYRSLDNNFRAISVKDLVESSSLLGASRWQTFIHVLIPNLQRGFIVAFFISIAFLIGEFVFTNLLAGGHFETIQIFLFSLRTLSGHLSSAVVISYFMVLVVLTGIVSMLSGDSHKS